MIDSHCHLDFNAFDGDREQVIQQARARGVTDIVIPGTEQRHWSRQIQLRQHFPGLHFALGLHPYFIQRAQHADLPALERSLHAQRDKVVAVGEIGLDYHQADAQQRQRQWDFFSAQLAIASQHQLPVILHHRQSHNDLIRALKQQKFAYGGVVHAFSGSLQQAQTYLDLGFKLGIGGTITYPRAKKSRETVSQLPLSSFLLETDAPDMPLHGRQGKRNSPVYLPEVATELAALTNTELAEVIAQTRANTIQLFTLA